jgi:hypothetical protein
MSRHSKNWRWPVLLPIALLIIGMEKRRALEAWATMLESMIADKDDEKVVHLSVQQ